METMRDHLLLFCVSGIKYGSKGYDASGSPAQLLSFVIDGSASPLLVEVLTNVGSMVLLPMPLPLEIQGDRDRDQMLALSFPHSRKQGSETRDSFYLEKKKELAQPRMELPPFHSMQRQWRLFVHSFRFRSALSCKGSAGIDGIEYVPLPRPIPGGPSYPPIGSGSGSSRVDSMASYTGEPVGVEVPGYGRDAERGDRDVEPDG